MFVNIIHPKSSLNSITLSIIVLAVALVAFKQLYQFISREEILIAQPKVIDLTNVRQGLGSP